MTADEARARFAAARVARLATRGPDAPRLVPVCFAVRDDLVWIAVDDVKPKRTRALARLRDIERDPAVALLADEYVDDDWSALWWVRAEGVGRVLDAAPDAVELLCERYPQYAAQPPSGPVIEVEVRRWSGWSAR